MSRRRPIGRVVWLLAAAVIAAATLSPSSERVSGSVSMCVICGDMGGVNSLLNVLLFVPLGVGLGLAGVRAARAIPVMVFATVLIELLQLGLVPGRDASVGDVLANAAGGVIGFLVAARLDGLLRPSAPRASGLMTAWLVAWIGLQAVAGFGLHPRPTDAAYFGQIARALGGKPAFPGRVLSATIDGDTIPDDRFGDSRRAQAALASANGAAISAAVVSRRYTPERASIVRIADQAEREVLDVAADKTDLVLGVRTGASVFRLRPLVVGLRGVLADSARAAVAGARDTVSIRAQYGFQRVQMSASPSGRAARAVAVTLTIAKGWRLFSPVVVYADESGVQSVFDVMWVLIGLMPAGYWAAIALRRGSPARRWPIIGALATALVAGLGLVPAVARLAATTPGEMLGAVAGLAAGAVVARAMITANAREGGDHPPAVNIVA